MCLFVFSLSHSLPFYCFSISFIASLPLISSFHINYSQGNTHYEPATDVRGQLKVLERIDEVSATRKQEREKEKIIRAAKSRSKQDDPELAKMKEQAKQVRPLSCRVACRVTIM